MGLFGKIKNILFEDDEEEIEMPVYTKEETKETQKRVENFVEETPVVEEPIKTSDNSHFKNVKRDIDLSFDEKDVLGDIPGGMENIPSRVEQRQEENVVQVEEKKSIFPSFDEDEFERLNSRINKNEARARREVKSVGLPVNNAPQVNQARIANNNFSSTVVDTGRIDTNDRYKVNTGTLGSGKKPFTPSPVISPVYGILDKNYTKDDIVDKKDGLKREKINKVKKEEVDLPVIKEETTLEVDIDSVRKKAYGELEELEKTLSNLEIPELKEEIIETIDVKEIELDEPSIEDILDQKFEIDDLDLNISKEEKELDEVVEKVLDDKNDNKTKHKPQKLDELEKTSTLQILDDIERELNSIKPISNNNDLDDDTIEDTFKNDDTLENDLFNLIDSMYEEGEEDER